jgi:hypothetical protein
MGVENESQFRNCDVNLNSVLKGMTTLPSMR